MFVHTIIYKYICIMDVTIDKRINSCLYFSVSHLHRILTKIAETEFAGTGWTPSYAFVMSIINEKPGIKVSEISGMIDLAPSTITRFIEKLELKKFIKRKTKGRNVLVFPLKKGKEIQKEIDNSWMSFFKKYADVIGHETAFEINDKLNNINQKILENDL